MDRWPVDVAHAPSASGSLATYQAPRTFGASVTLKF
jgi:hypothetical protein